MGEGEARALDDRYGIAGHLAFREGPGGLVAAEVTNAGATATIALQGAQVLSWVPRGGHPVVWLSEAAVFSPGKPVRGGIPVCWPWFGPHPTEPSYPSHGFARASLWQVTQTTSHSDTVTRLSLQLIQGEASRPLWPHPSRLDIHVSVGAVLTIELVTQNIGPAPITVGEALHAYFDVADVRQVTVDGFDGCHYLDKVDNGRRKTQFGRVKFEAETDRIYLDTVGDCLIHDPGLRRRIRISKGGSRSTVIWNPWTEKAAQLGDMGENGYLKMVCVESANAADNVVTVAPGHAHRLWTRYQVEALP